MSQELSSLIKELTSLTIETEWVEFKLNNFHPQEIGEYISALSNSARLLGTNYGYLVYGIESDTHKIVGTNFIPKKTKVGSEELENWLATQLDPLIDFQILDGVINGKNMVVFKIDSTRSRPVRFKGVEYIRIGSYKKKLSSHPEKERKIWDICRGFVFENDITKKEITSDEIFQLIDYPAFFDLTKLPLPTNKSGILEKLIEEKLINKRYDNCFDITNLGAILFSKKLGSFERLARKAIRVIQYKGKNKVLTIKEQLWDKGYANGFESLIDYINNLLPTNEVIEKALRKEIKMYPEIAIRELVANAIIHQDFYEAGTSPLIEIYEDRIEISNPGKPLIPTLRFIDHNPQSRNEQLASLMRRLKICEERGSGIDKVIFYCELFQLPAINFIVGDNFIKAILYSYKKLRQMDKEDKVRACYQHCCLKNISNEFMTNQTLRERFRLKEENYPMISRIIADTIEAKLVKYEDPLNKARRYAKYVPFWA